MCEFAPDRPDEQEPVFMVFLPTEIGFAATPDCVTSEREAAWIWGEWHRQQKRRYRRMRYANPGVN